jgi:hypothetical protein
MLFPFLQLFARDLVQAVFIYRKAIARESPRLLVDIETNL